MKNSILLILLCVACTPARAASILLSLQPSQQTVEPGAIASVDVIVTGLGLPPAVGAYDLDLTFDPAFLLPVGIGFGPNLGDEALFEVINSFNFFPDTMDFAAVSVLSNSALYALQGVSFRLATIDFQALQPGVTPLSFTELRIDDEFAAKFDVTGSDGTITVVPESRCLPLAGGLVVLVALRRASERRGRPSAG